MKWSNPNLDYRINLDKVELEYIIPQENLETLKNGYSYEGIEATPSMTATPYYDFTLDLYLRYKSFNLLIPTNLTYLGKMYFGTKVQYRQNVYIMLDNKLLYKNDGMLKTYLTDIENFIVSLSGHFSKIMKLEIAFDCPVDLIEKYETLTQTPTPQIMYKGKPKNCRFAFNGKVLRQHADNNFLEIRASGSTENPYKTKTIYIKGKFFKKHPKSEIKIYNKSKEVYRNGNQKTYILDYFLSKSNYVFRFEVSITSPYYLKQYYEELWRGAPNYKNFLCSPVALSEMLEYVSCKLFSTIITYNHDTIKFDFLDLLNDDSIICNQI